MKYYAVTDDPNELMHYGILGMKWGVLRTPEQLGHRKPPKTNVRKVQSLLKSAQKAQKRSPAYISASDKLRKMTKHGIKKAEADWSVDTKKAQNMLLNYKRDMFIRNANKQAQKNEKAYNRSIKNANKQVAKNEKLFQKHVQLARQGRLKYKGLSDEEVSRITDRLDLERPARQLSGSEKPSFMRRLGSAVGDGIISGISRGASNRVSEFISRGGELKTQRKMQEQSAQFARKRAREDFNRRMQEESRVRVRDVKRHKQDDAYKDQHDLDLEYAKLMGESGYDVNNEPKASNATKRYRINAIKENRRISEQNDQDYREDRRAERQMIRDVMRDKRQDMLSVYNTELSEYNKNVKRWKKNGSDPRDEPQRPVRPIFDVDDYFNQYDTYRARRTR